MNQPTAKKLLQYWLFYGCVEKSRNQKLRLSSALLTILATSVAWNFAVSIPAIANANSDNRINALENQDNSPEPILIKQPKTIPLLASIRELRVTQPSTLLQNPLPKPNIEEKIAQEPDVVPTDPDDQPEFPTAPDSQLESPTAPNNQPESPTVPDGQLESPTAPNNQPESQAESRVLVAEVDVTGVDERLTEIVYDTIDTKPGRTTTRTQLQEDINAIYAVGFFQNVEVIPEDTPLGVKITFAVVPNPILNEVTVETLPADVSKQVLPPEVLTDIFSPGYGELLNLRDLQEGIKQVNQWYSENGYELAQVVGSPEVNQDGTVVLIVAEGVIENIKVSFLDEEDEPTEGKTRDFIITREIELQPGDVFNRDTAQRDLQRVFGLGIFEDIRLSFEPGEDPSQVVINVIVVENSTGSIAAGAGFSSSSGLFGTVSYQQQNLGGNNQTIGTEFQLGERELLFDVSFTDPWIGGDPYRTSYTVNGFRRRSISLVYDGDDNDIRTDNGNDSPRVVRTGGGINFSRPLSTSVFEQADWTLNTGFQYQRAVIKNRDGEISPVSRPEDGSENLAFSDSGEDDLFFLRFGATRDKRNSRLQPTKGSLLRFGVDQTIPIGSGTILFSRLRTSFSYFIPTNLIRITEGPQAFAFNIQAGGVLGDLPPYEAFVVGGSNSVRGYREGEVANGRAFLQGTVEYRFPVFRIVGGALFADYGTVLGTDWNVPGEPSVVRGLPGSGFGYGLGVRVRSPLGPIRVDYAINQDGDSRIHFGIGERF